MPKLKRKTLFSKVILLTLTSLMLNLAVVQVANADSTAWKFPTTSTKVSRKFEPPAHNWLAGHRGIDFPGVIGQEIYSTWFGTVVFADSLAGKGVVVISHGLVRTTYEPVDAQVSVGDEVIPGQLIGKLSLGVSHCSTDEKVWCLHWGAIRNGRYLNPLLLIYPKVRLLPLRQ